jgi:hypothetical protein
MGFPRFFKVGGYLVSAYKVFLCIGIYSGVLVSAAVAERSGIPPLRMGAGCLTCAVTNAIITADKARPSATQGVKRKDYPLETAH